MARLEADLSHFMLASDYNPAHYNWTEKELAALGGCRATAEVIKKRLEDNGAKVKEMYAIEHKGEKKAAKKFPNDVDETKVHYHILVRFEPSRGATLEEISKFIGVPREVIEKPRRGPSYNNMLSYLIHIKDVSKIQYTPEDVVTLAGSDYMDYYNANKEGWIKRGRAAVAEKGGKTLDHRFREAISKLESGELSCNELAGMTEYRKLFLSPKYQRKLEAAAKRVEKLAYLDKERLKGKCQNGEISMEEAKESEEYKLVFKYYKGLSF